MYGLEIENLCVDFGNFKLDNINLKLRRGCITGLVGRNGCGKTTLISAIMRQVEATGSILYNGKPYKGNESEIMNSLACVFDKPHFNQNLKPKKIIKLYSAIYSDLDLGTYYNLMDKFRLPHELKLSKYSFGMQRKYCLILALCRNADILILDEPTSGVDPYDRGEIMDLIQEFIMDENRTVLFSTHVTEDLDKIADYIVMMNNGAISLDCDKETLIDGYRLVQCETLTPEMQAAAIGVQKSMFGYVFLTRDKDIKEGEGIKVKVPTIEEAFVHLQMDKRGLEL